MVKNLEKEKAIELRKKGLSYSEILDKISVAKSTLSLWLRSVGLSKRQKQRLTEKKLAAMKKGWKSRHNKKVIITKEIINQAKRELSGINKRELWLIGVALYWGEGHKEKLKGCLVQLGNSDPLLIKIFLKWTLEICKIPKKDICFRIFLHDNSKKRLYLVRKYWSDITGFPIEEFQKITWKKNKIRTKRINIGENYFGLLRVTVKKSTNLNRKIKGWIEGICEYCGVV